MKLIVCTVVVHISTDILVEFHCDSCESSQDMAFSATLEADSVNCRSILVFLVTFSHRNFFISLSLFDPSDSTI